MISSTYCMRRARGSEPDLYEALKPLANLDLRGDGLESRSDDQIIYQRDESKITVGDVRRALPALAKAEDTKS